MTTHFLLETWRSLRESNSAMHGFKISKNKEQNKLHVGLPLAENKMVP